MSNQGILLMPRDQCNKTRCLTGGLRGDTDLVSLFSVSENVYLHVGMTIYIRKEIQTHRGGKKKKKGKLCLKKIRWVT